MHRPGTQTSERQAIAKVQSSGQLVEEIARIEAAQQLMLRANQALKSGDTKTLGQMGFSDTHIAELNQRGGFPRTAFRNNRQLLSYLRKQSP